MFYYFNAAGNCAGKLQHCAQADKEYPYLNEASEALDLEIKQQIVKNTKAMICHKIGGMVVFSSSNLVLSKFAGLAAVGLYSNYYMVIAALNTLLLNSLKVLLPVLAI